MTQLDDQQLREQINGAVPASPEGLRESCVSSATAVAGRSDDSWTGAGHTRRRWFAPASLAAAAVFVAVIAALLFVQRGQRQAAAQSLSAALGAFDEITAARVVTSFDDGPGTEATRQGVFTSVLDYGWRGEDEHSIVVYSGQDGMRASLDRKGKRVELVEIEDESILRTMLDRTKAEQNVTVLHAIALQKSGAVSMEEFELDERAVRRLGAIDEHGRPIVVEIDVLTNRVLRTESWTRAYEGSPSVRVIHAFEYPDPASIDPKLFDWTELKAQEVVKLSGVHLVRRQAMVNLRNLMMMVNLYASEHADELPATVDDLARYADRPLEEYTTLEVPDGEEPVRLRAYLDRFAGRRTHELDPGAVLFDYDFGTSVVAGFVDGHVAVIEKKDD